MKFELGRPNLFFVLITVTLPTYPNAVRMKIQMAAGTFHMSAKILWLPITSHWACSYSNILQIFSNFLYKQINRKETFIIEFENLHPLSVGCALKIKTRGIVCGQELKAIVNDRKWLYLFLLGPPSCAVHNDLKKKIENIFDWQRYYIRRPTLGCVKRIFVL